MSTFWARSTATEESRSVDVARQMSAVARISGMDRPRKFSSRVRSKIIGICSARCKDFDVIIRTSSGGDAALFAAKRAIDSLMHQPGLAVTLIVVVNGDRWNECLVNQLQSTRALRPRTESRKALIGFRGGRVEGAEARPGVEFGLSVSIGAADALFGEPVVAAR